MKQTTRSLSSSSSARATRGSRSHQRRTTAGRKTSRRAAVIASIDAGSDAPQTVAVARFLLGHSYGGFCALGAAALTANLRALILYEPALAGAGDDLPAGVVERIEARLASGDLEGALELMMREVVRMPDPELALVRAQPSWAARVAAAHTIPRELLAVTGEVLQAIRFDVITVPALLIAGGDSPAYFRRDIDTVASALPDARVTVIDGQQHVADVLAPQTFAEHVLEFLAERS